VVLGNLRDRALRTLTKEQLRLAIIELGGYHCDDDSKELLAACLARMAPNVQLVVTASSPDGQKPC